MKKLMLLIAVCLCFAGDIVIPKYHMLIIETSVQPSHENNYLKRFNKYWYGQRNENSDYPSIQFSLWTNSFNASITGRVSRQSFSQLGGNVTSNMLEDMIGNVPKPDKDKVHQYIWTEAKTDLQQAYEDGWMPIQVNP